MVSEAEVDDSAVLPTFERKCEHEDLDVDLRDGLPGGKREEIRAGWQNTLPDLVSDLPEFEPVYDALEAYVGSR